MFYLKNGIMGKSSLLLFVFPPLDVILMSKKIGDLPTQEALSANSFIFLLLTSQHIIDNISLSQFIL